MKPIRLSAHALSYITKRGFTVAEVEDTIRSGPWEPAELGRMECRKTFPFNREWNKRRYATKEVRPIFVEEADEIVVVTVILITLDGGHNMKISYDSEVDALSITFRETTVTTKHLGEGIAADYDADGKLAGIEILDAIKRFGGKETLRQVVIEGLGPTQTT